ncbi:MAG: UPF0147 family protein, partial [Methanobacteriota archaeon]
CEEGSLPRRVREALSKVADDLKLTGEDSAVQVTSAIYELEEIANDVNIAVHAKTIIWDIISTLESLKTS